MALPGEALRLEAEGIGPLVEFPQSHSRMVPASERLASAVIERRVRNHGDPDLDRHVAMAVAKPSGRGWRLDKLTSSGPTVNMMIRCDFPMCDMLTSFD
jgi:hypothetical protein